MLIAYICLYSGTCLIRHTKGPGKCVADAKDYIPGAEILQAEEQKKEG
jgi:hypothetical protein